MKENYTPTPIDTSSIQIPDSLRGLVELLSENNHDVWALGRIGEDWTYGATRDDRLKHHPCLVPYDKLPESEKEYDRNSVLETLKAIIALGYRIEKG